MLKLKRFAKVSSLQVTVSDDASVELSSLYIRLSSNVNVYLLIEGPEDITYVLDLDKLLLYEDLPTNIATIGDLVSYYLTPQLLYSYQTDHFNFSKYIRSFPAENVEEEIQISACKQATGETTTLIDDPSFPDVVVGFTEFKLNQTLPVIDGKVYPCSWRDDKIYLTDTKAELVNNPTWSFLSLTEADDIEITLLSELEGGGWVVPEGYSPILVLNGHIHFNDNWVFSSNGKLTLADKILSDNPSLTRFNDLDELIADKLSFVIFVKCRQLYVEETSTIKIGDRLYQFCSSYKEAKPIDLMCVDKHTGALQRAVDVIDQYQDIKLSNDPYTHYVYMESPGSEIKMMQFTIA